MSQRQAGVQQGASLRAANDRVMDEQRGSASEPGKDRGGSVAWGLARLAFAIAVIYTAYLVQGQVQEQLAKSRYGLRGAAFERMEALIGFQCIVCFLWAGLLELLLKSRSRRSSNNRGGHSSGTGAGSPPPLRYAVMGITNVIGPACGVYALKKISYPAQTLAKSCKSVPIMLTGALLYKKRYSAAEYASVAAVGVGIGMFALASKPGKASMGDTDPVLGYALVAANLLLDSLTNTSQDQVKKQYPEVTGMHMMCWINFWGGLFYSIVFFAMTSTGTEVVRFCLQHREAMWHLLSFCMCGAIGQLGIFYAVAQFGTLVTSLVCTTRKGFSILLSVLRSGAMLTLQQTLAAGLVFAGLLGKQLVSRRKKGGGTKGGKTL